MTNSPPPPTLSIRVCFGGKDMMGPGKAELLDRIATMGSISAAAREMDMSYKRAWMLIETLNDMFDGPVVKSTRGGPGKGGAVLTERGKAVLAEYRGLEVAALAHTVECLEKLQGWLRVAALPDQQED